MYDNIKGSRNNLKYLNSKKSNLIQEIENLFSAREGSTIQKSPQIKKIKESSKQLMRKSTISRLFTKSTNGLKSFTRSHSVANLLPTLNKSGSQTTGLSSFLQKIKLLEAPMNSSSALNFLPVNHASHKSSMALNGNSHSRKKNSTMQQSKDMMFLLNLISQSKHNKSSLIKKEDFTKTTESVDCDMRTLPTDNSKFKRKKTKIQSIGSIINKYKIKGLNEPQDEETSYSNTNNVELSEFISLIKKNKEKSRLKHKFSSDSLIKVQNDEKEKVIEEINANCTDKENNFAPSGYLSSRRASNFGYIQTPVPTSALPASSISKKTKESFIIFNSFREQLNKKTEVFTKPKNLYQIEIESNLKRDLSKKSSITIKAPKKLRSNDKLITLPSKEFVTYKSPNRNSTVLQISKHKSRSPVGNFLTIDNSIIMTTTGSDINKKVSSIEREAITKDIKNIKKFTKLEDEDSMRSESSKSNIESKVLYHNAEKLSTNNIGYKLLINTSGSKGANTPINKFQSPKRPSHQINRIENIPEESAEATSGLLVNFLNSAETQTKKNMHEIIPIAETKEFNYETPTKIQSLPSNKHNSFINKKVKIISTNDLIYRNTEFKEIEPLKRGSMTRQMTHFINKESKYSSRPDFRDEKDKEKNYSRKSSKAVSQFAKSSKLHIKDLIKRSPIRSSNSKEVGIKQKLTINIKENEDSSEDLSEKAKEYNTDEEEENLKKYIKSKITDIRYFFTDKCVFNEEVGVDMLKWTKSTFNDIIDNINDTNNIEEIFNREQSNMECNPIKRFKDYFKLLKYRVKSKFDKQKSINHEKFYASFRTNLNIGHITTLARCNSVREEESEDEEDYDMQSILNEKDLPSKEYLLQKSNKYINGLVNQQKPGKSTKRSNTQVQVLNIFKVCVKRAYEDHLQDKTFVTEQIINIKIQPNLQICENAKNRMIATYFDVYGNISGIIKENMSQGYQTLFLNFSNSIRLKKKQDKTKQTQIEKTIIQDYLTKVKDSKTKNYLNGFVARDFEMKSEEDFKAMYRNIKLFKSKEEMTVIPSSNGLQLVNEEELDFSELVQGPSTARNKKFFSRTSLQDRRKFKKCKTLGEDDQDADHEEIGEDDKNVSKHDKRMKKQISIMNSKSHLFTNL